MNIHKGYVDSDETEGYFQPLSYFISEKHADSPKPVDDITRLGSLKLFEHIVQGLNCQEVNS
ncbi:hypothetical protein CWB96_19435 [Pseudoalteromonas citrea]|uniref:Uncharacterized protein n=1 Tax=Pseudoalteromonas citrea TaxID=43655 RepID=A0A5S3XKU6_9GAMM|nr:MULTISPECIES: hypothetical protein [Pseudoalteromonas]RJE78211.1 hypothetical protein BGP78_05845 [Pseudoalteromonas sp. MSK9-3]TMP38787.1 hypothetical protein CWB97_21560 [Pseudoalteromonas citrea]TMP54334.1 hypothetical protein CWB96_19435 [Pseudoalteromonas citrea]